MVRNLLTYRVVTDTGHHDVLVSIEDSTTVAQLAASIAAFTGSTGKSTGKEAGAPDEEEAGARDNADELTIELVGDAPRTADPRLPAVDAAPPSGSTVRVVAARGSTVQPPWWSPVSVTRLDGDTQDHGSGARLAYGSGTRLAYGSGNLGSAVVVVDSVVVVNATGSTDRLEVDGTPVRGSHPARHGSIIRVGDSTFVLSVDGPLRPPAATGPWRSHRASPAVHEDPEPEPVELPCPPSEDRTPGFPYLSALVPLLMGAAMWVATRSLAVAGFVLFSVAFIVASGIEARREHRRDRRFREQTFLHDLEAAAASARRHREQELRRAVRDLPTGNEVTAWAIGDRRRMWERRVGNPGSLRVRIGTERVRPHDPVVVPKGGREDLRERMDEIAEELGRLERPTAVDLVDSGLAIVGKGVEATALARSVVAQVVCLLGPDELELEVDAATERSAAWGWLLWLPHRVVFLDPAATVDPVPEPAPRPGSNRVVVRVTDRLETAVHGAGPRCVVVVPTEAEVPAGCATVVGAGDGPGWVRRDDGPRTDLTVESLTADRCEPAARAMSPLHGASADDASPTTVHLGDLLADPTVLQHGGPDLIRSRWSASREHPERLTMPIGIAVQGEHGQRQHGQRLHGHRGVVHIDLRSDGPHGLVAGTTGAGKSELLRTLVTSLALHHPPDRLTFLLVDYKGGAAFSALSTLPHVVGLVTDLGPATARRALASLRAEVRRREKIVSDARATDMVEVAVDRAAPALVVVVDEFATLTREVPEMLDGLLDVAQRGRSLGIHLILATQRPSGVVTDAVRANLSLRIALRVADEDDSRDVVDVPDAAHISAELPGRAVLRLGPRRAVMLQVAGTADPLQSHVAARCQNLTEGFGLASGSDQPTADSDGRSVSEIAAAVANCRFAAAVEGLEDPRRPWVDPLPNSIGMDPRQSPEPGRLVIGEADLPDEQRRGPAVIDMTSGGNVLVLGPPRSGRSTALEAIGSAALTDPATPTTVYAITPGRTLTNLIGRSGPGGRVGDVIAVDDLERTLRLLRMLQRHVQRVPSGHAEAGMAAGPCGFPGTERTVVMVDGIGALVDRHDDVNRAEAVDLLTSIAAGGPAVGIHLAITASRRADVPSALAPSMDRLLVLRSNDPWEIDTDPDAPPGRGHLDGVVVQVGVPAPEQRDATTERRAWCIGRLPLDVEARLLPAASGWRIPVGVRHDDLGTALLDLTHNGALVVGPPRSGRTTALRTVLDRVQSDAPDVRVAWIDPATDASTARATLELLADVAAPLGPMLVAVDDLPELLEGPDGPILDELLVRLLRGGSGTEVRLVASGEADAASRCYSDSFRRLRSTRTGILLRPDVDLHPGILHATLPRHDELAPAPGRGWIVSPDEVAAAQLAR